MRCDAMPLLVVAVALAFYRQAFLFSATAVLVVVLTTDREAWRSFGMASLIDFVDRVLSCKIARHAGDMSFGVYLFHMLLVVPSAYYMSQYPPIRDSAGSLRLACIVVVAGIATYLLSLAGHYLIERPFIETGRGFIDRISAGRALRQPK